MPLSVSGGWGESLFLEWGVGTHLIIVRFAGINQWGACERIRVQVEGLSFSDAAWASTVFTMLFREPTTGSL
jgi:hypothetical protein